MKLEREKLVILTSDNSFFYNGIRREGFNVEHPYKGKSIILKILRRIAFKFCFFSFLWYNKEIIKKKPDYIVMNDPLITLKYIKWLRKKLPLCQLNFNYLNLVGFANHLFPDEIPSYVRVFTYDRGDSLKYSINYVSSHMFFSSYIVNHKKNEYDVFFVGKDKGRLEFLSELEEKFKKLGLKTKFVITKDSKFSKNKKEYSNALTYEEVINYDSRSKALLNITMPNQDGVTLRDMESIFLETKLITTNKNIVNEPFYNKNNIFIIGIDDFEKIPSFMSTSFEKIDNSILEKYSVENYYSEIIFKKECV